LIGNVTAVDPLTGDDPAEIAGYQLRSRLGSGGMGRVYLALTPAGRPVALKVVRPDLGGDAEFRRRFRQEVDASCRVHGLYTAQVLDADPDASPPWLVTAYVPGPSLQQAVARHGPMPEQTVFVLLAGVAEALAAIHAAGIVHRDLKPSNVLLAPDGPRVIDFGIARAADSTVLTGTGMLIGSPAFMAPEQVAGQAITQAVDVFALGARRRRRLGDPLPGDARGARPGRVPSAAT
jgi:serine/threonine protein kinase